MQDFFEDDFVVAKKRKLKFAKLCIELLKVGIGAGIAIGLNNLSHMHVDNWFYLVEGLGSFWIVDYWWKKIVYAH